MAHRQATLQLTHRTIGRSNRKHRDTQGITDGQTESETVEGRKRRKATTMRKKRMCGGRNTLKLFQSKACISGKHTATNTRKIHLLNAPLFARLVPVQFTDIQFHFLEKHKPVATILITTCTITIFQCNLIWTCLGQNHNRIFMKVIRQSYWH